MDQNPMVYTCLILSVLPFFSNNNNNMYVILIESIGCYVYNDFLFLDNLVSIRTGTSPEMCFYEVPILTLYIASTHHIQVRTVPVLVAQGDAATRFVCVKNERRTSRRQSG